MSEPITFYEAFTKAWNKNVPVGTPVTLINDFGSEEETETRSEAWVTPSGSCLVSVKGRTGGYLAERLIPHTEIAKAEA